MGIFDIFSGYDSGGATRATASADQMEGDNLGTYNAAAQGNQTLNTQLGNQNYYGTAQQVYGQQQAAANMLQAQANGTAPSAASIQQGVGLQAANAGAQSAALSQQGAMNPALAARNMLSAQANTAQGVIASGTAQRAQEQATAQQQYNSVLGNMQNQQQQQGSLQYNQGQGMLTNAMNMTQQQYQNAQNNAQTVLANRMGQYQTAATQNQAGMTAAGQLAGAAASGITGVPQTGSLAAKVINS